MLKAYKYRIYPNSEQIKLINKHFDCCRLIYNLGLEVNKESYKTNNKYISSYDLIKQITELKKDHTWLNEINSQSPQSSLLNLGDAFKRFFNHQCEYPKFISKNDKQSFKCPQNIKIDFEKNKIYLPKFKGGIKIIIDRKFKGQIKTTTISKTKSNKYFASILVDNKKKFPIKSEIKKETTIGIDIGIKSFVVLSNGKAYDNPKYLNKSLKRLIKFKKRLSKKKKFSKNYNKAKLKLALIHEKIKNQRKDFLHKLSSKLISDNQTICIEDLNISGMLKNHKLSKSISDCGWSEFIRMLKYKAEWNGKNISMVGRFEPSSKMCSNCGEVYKELELFERQWICKNCRFIHDRDLNAAKNIKHFALKNYTRKGIPKEPVEMPTLVGSMMQEVLN